MNKVEIKSKYPLVISTVDIIVEQNNCLLMGKKPGKDTLCLLGGFADPEQDSTKVDSAVREFYEESGGLVLTNPTLLFDITIDDSRYKDSKHNIITNVYTGTVIEQIDLKKLNSLDLDDIESLHLVPIEKLQTDEINTIVSKIHIPIINFYLNIVKLKEKLKVLDFLQELRFSHKKMIDIYSNGSELNLYCMLKIIFPFSVAYFDGKHIITKIGNYFYDINGIYETNEEFFPLHTYKDCDWIDETFTIMYEKELTIK